MLLMVGGLALGVFARFDSLGGTPLAVDEYYFVRSVEFILDRGVPEFPTGGFYTRGLLPQYLTAGAILTFGDNAFSYRLPAVLFSLGSLALFFVYSRGFLHRDAALALTLILLVSSWEVEFARFSRMYAALQFFTLLFLIAVDHAFFRGRWNWRYGPHLLVILTCLTHSLGVLLTPLVFIPLIVRRQLGCFPTSWHLLRFLGVSILTAILSVGWVKFPARGYQVFDQFPEDFSFPSALGGSFRVPLFPFWSLSENPLINLGVFCGVLLLVAAVLWGMKGERNEGRQADIILGLLVASTIFHNFLVAVFFLCVLVFRFELYRWYAHPMRRYVLLGVSACVAVGWIMYALIVQDWLGSGGAELGGFAGRVRRTFFGWPDFYKPVLRVWRQELPIIVLLGTGALFYQLITRLKDPLVQLLQNPTMFLVYIIGCFGILQSAMSETRYLFFVYPVIWCVIGLSLQESMGVILSRWTKIGQGARKMLVAFSCLVVFGCTADFNPTHLLNVGSMDARFRMNQYEQFSSTWYARWDYETPALFVNRLPTFEDTDKIIVVKNPPISYYLQKDHAVYLARDSHQFTNVSREKGTIDLWSNRRLLSVKEDVQEFTRYATIVWLIRPVQEKFQYIPINDVWNGRLLHVSREMVSLDQRIEVMRVTLSRVDS